MAITNNGEVTNSGAMCNNPLTAYYALPSINFQEKTFSRSVEYGDYVICARTPNARLRAQYVRFWTRSFDFRENKARMQETVKKEDI
jgi:hypothetical protein